MNSALFVDIQRGSVHDGPGIRTTFFLKGCPLRCAWCHNPESQAAAPQLSFHASRCVGCGACAAACPNGAHRLSKTGEHTVDLAACTACGRCAAVCVNEAVRLIGRRYTVEQAVELAFRDMPFYRNSGGGVTLSGGEPLSQWAFGAAFLAACRQKGIHTCLDTSGVGTAQAMQALAAQSDLIYFDWKIGDADRLLTLTGASLALVEGNLAIAAAVCGQVTLRCPVIPGLNDTPAHFASIGAVAERYPAIREVHLLPYHDFGIGKATNIQMEQQRFRRPMHEERRSWEQAVTACVPNDCRVVLQDA